MESSIDDRFWNNILSLDNVDECLDCFYTVVSYLIDNLTPLKDVRVRHGASPWYFTPEVKKVRNLRVRAHREALKVNSQDAWSNFRQLRNKANSLTCCARADT